MTSISTAPFSINRWPIGSASGRPLRTKAWLTTATRGEDRLVGGGEKAPSKQGNPQGLEIARCREVVIGAKISRVRPAASV